jgi:cytidylate kinase
MSNKVITISREFGTGARTIAQKLAIELGYAYYDRAIIQMAAEKSGLSPNFIEKNEEKANNSFLFNIATSAYISSGINLQYTVPVNDRAYIAQSEVIRELVEKENCVIVGRCANYVLADHENIMRVFVRADKKDRIRRCVEEYGFDAKTVEAELTKIDKGRASYYKFYTGDTWKNMDNYDICINTSRIEIDDAVRMLLDYARISLK